MNTPSACVTLAALAVALCGCHKHVTQKDITSDLTPELKGISMRPQEAHNALAVAQNANMRMFSDDLARTFLTNTPSRLSPFPIINTSGQGW